jgi:hypothetical protein
LDENKKLHLLKAISTGNRLNKHVFHDVVDQRLTTVMKMMNEALDQRNDCVHLMTDGNVHCFIVLRLSMLIELSIKIVR